MTTYNKPLVIVSGQHRQVADEAGIAFNAMQAASGSNISIASSLVAESGSGLDFSASSAAFKTSSGNVSINGAATFAEKADFNKDVSLKSTANLSLDSGNLTMSSGSLTMTSGNITMSSGSLAVTAGDGTFGGKVTGGTAQFGATTLTAMLTATDGYFSGNLEVYKDMQAGTIHAGATTLTGMLSGVDGYLSGNLEVYKDIQAGTIHAGATTLTGMLSGVDGYFSADLSADSLTATGAVLGASASFANLVGAGSLNVTGDGYLYGDMHVVQDLTVDGDGYVWGNAHVVKDLTVDGNMEMNDGYFWGNVHVVKDLAVDGNLSVTGAELIYGGSTFVVDTANVLINESSVVIGNADNTGSLTVNSGATFKSAVSMESTLGVASLSTLSGGFTTGLGPSAGNGSIGGTLGVASLSTLSGGFTTGLGPSAGNGSIGGTLGVAGLSTLSGGANISGGAGDSLSVTGTSSLTGNVTITGAATVTSNLSTGYIYGYTASMLPASLSLKASSSFGPSAILIASNGLSQAITIGNATSFDGSSASTFQLPNNFVIGSDIVGGATSSNVSAANLNTLTGGSASNADALHTHAASAAIRVTFAGAPGSVAASGLSASQVVSYDSNGKLAPADADDGYGAVGFSFGNYSGLAAPTIVVSGEVSVPSALWSTAPTSADVGSRVYISGTGGKVTCSAPTEGWIQKVGILSSVSAISGDATVIVQIGDSVQL